MLQVDADRLWGSLLEMGQAGKVEAGVNRLALGDGDKAARDLFTRWLREEGAEVRVDEIGNIFGIRKGGDSSLSPVMVGSHLDTVKGAGVLDGALGVLSGLLRSRLD